MCGLIFQYKKNIHAKHLQESSKRALSAMAHRGPDDEGIWIDPPAAIGHRRLSIIDIDYSQQPMSDPSGRYLLSYNGEVYNFEDLKERLKERWQFVTKGDTEVVLAGLVLEGTGFLDHMEGMWAIAFWDNLKKVLFLIRDRLGKKPLYYSYNQKEFACASELKALSVLVSDGLQEDFDSTSDFFRYGFFLPGYTAYKNVYEVLPGHYLKWKPENEIEQHAYWTLHHGLQKGLNKTETIVDLEQKFISAIKKRLIADVEVGAFLSGGIDSSLIVSIIRNKLGRNIKTFTIGFDEKSFDESRYANKIAKRFNTEHYLKIFNDWDKDNLLNIIMNNVGQPFADVSLLPTAMVSSLASEKVKVVLSGDGGDELFSGYQRYQARSILRWYTRLPSMIRNNIQRVIKSIPEPMSHHSSSFLKKAHLFQGIVDRLEMETPYIAPVFYSDAQFKSLFPDLGNNGHHPPNLPKESKLDDITQMMLSDTLIYLPQDILVKVDRSSMAYSVETRAPFLDKDVVELAFSIPRRWHRRGLKGKKMLFSTFKNTLPIETWFRRKQGFSVPLYRWFRGGLGDELDKLIMRDNTLIQASEVSKLLFQHRNGIKDHGYRLWSIYVYLLWKQQTNTAF